MAAALHARRCRAPTFAPPTSARVPGASQVICACTAGESSNGQRRWGSAENHSGCSTTAAAEDPAADGWQLRKEATDPHSHRAAHQTERGKYRKDPRVRIYPHVCRQWGVRAGRNCRATSSDRVHGLTCRWHLTAMPTRKKTPTNTAPSIVDNHTPPPTPLRETPHRPRAFGIWSPSSNS